MKMIRVALVLSAALLATVQFAHAEAAPNYKIVDRIKVPDGGFDYATFDAATNHIYMPRTDVTTAIDVKTKQVTQFKNAARGHIFLPVPGTTLAVLTQRTGTVRKSIRGMFAGLEQEHPRLQESLLAAMGHIETSRLLDTRYLNLDDGVEAPESESLFPIFEES